MHPISTSTFAVLFAFFALSMPKIQAGWFDDLVDGVGEKVSSGVDFLKNEAAPAVVEKFGEAKAAIEETEVPQKVHSWFKESAIPAVKTKYNEVKTFIHEGTAPNTDETTPEGVNDQK